MALVEKTVIDKIEVVGPFKHIQVRENRQVVDDATGEVRVEGEYHRYVLGPTDDISAHPDDVKAIANAVWTDEIKAAYAEHIAG